MIQVATRDTLARASVGSWYTITGTGGDLNEWVKGYEKILDEREIGTPTEWWRASGAEVNMFAIHTRWGETRESDLFQPDLTFLLFPLDGLAVGRLAILRIQMQDHWFDDIIANMRLV